MFGLGRHNLRPPWANIFPWLAFTLLATSVLGQPTVTLTMWPRPGSLTSVSGRATNALGYRAAIYVRDPAGAYWGPKPNPGAGTAIGADGTFTIAQWYNDPADTNAPGLGVCVIPGTIIPPDVRGGPLPTIAGAACTRITRTDPYPGGGTGTATVTLTPPAPGSTAAVTGRVSALPSAATNYRGILYVQAGDGNWWGAKGNVALGGDGSFTFAGWANDPNDATVPRFGVWIVPASFNAPMVLGTAIPATITSASVATAQADRSGGVAPVTPPGPAPAPVTPGGSGEMPFPPGPPSGKTVPAGGFINFAGYRWIVKDSRGNRVGPGNNIFVAGPDNVWTDNWGLHFNIVPTQGCNRWTASEVWLDRALGFGTYLVRIVGPQDAVDPDVTWSPFFIWDDSGNAGNGWREIDIEFARWGNAGDPTSSQYVLRPLQSGGMVPGWRVRYSTRQERVRMGAGQGGGGCNNPGQDNFNGAAVTYTTCAVRWFNYRLTWYCVDGLYTLQTLRNAPRTSLLASYNYGYPSYIPDRGDARVHINLWLQNGAQPRWGRRSHHVIQGFEYTQADITFPNFPDDANIARRGLLGVPTQLQGFAQGINGTELGEQVRLLQAQDPDIGPPAYAQSCGDPTGQSLQLTAMAAEQSVTGASVEANTASGVSMGGQLPYQFPYQYQSGQGEVAAGGTGGGGAEAGMYQTPNY